MSTSIFSFPIAYVESLEAFESVEAVARDVGRVKGLAIKLHEANGDNPFTDQNRRVLERGAAKRLRGRGYVLGAWSCPRTEPEKSAEAMSALYGALGLSFAIFETENEYKTDGGKIDVARLWRRWRELRPRAYTGAAVLGNMPTTYNYAAGAGDIHYLAENYYNQNGAFDFRTTLARAVELGIPLERVHPTITGVEWNQTTAESLIRAYSATLTAPGASERIAGFAIWRGDSLTFSDYRLIGLAGGLALRA